MSRMKIKIIVFCYICQLYYIYAVVKVQHKRLDFADKDLIFGHDSFKDGKLTYATCTKNRTSYQMMCTVIREKAHLSNDTYSCNITLKLLLKKGKYAEVDDQFGIVPFGKDKAVFYIVQLYKRTKTRFNTIQFDGCKVTQTNLTMLEVDYLKYFITIIPYSNSYDVIYPSRSDGIQKVTINSYGVRVNGPTVLDYFMYTGSYPHMLPISRKSRSKGFIYWSFSSDLTKEYDLILWRPDRFEKVLGRHEILWRTIKSTDNDLIGICNDLDDSMHHMKCMQYDADGHLEFETDPIRNESESIIFIYNAPGGGFYLLGGRFSNESDNLDFFLMKLDSAGKHNGSLNLGEIELESDDSVTAAYKNGDSEYCVAIANYLSYDGISDQKNSSCFIDLTVGCFNDSDFTV